MEYAIRVKNVSKKYKIYNHAKDKLKETFFNGKKIYHNEFWALKSVSFDVTRGKTVGIIGRNGSGKSTILQVICGTLSSTQGQIEINGRISALLELGTAFNPEFTGRDNIYTYCAVMGLSKKEIDERFKEIEEFAEIGEFIDKPVRTYSSGMYVRLAFSAAINVNPDILIVDEALAVGDIGFQRKCYRKFEEFKEKGVTIILVTHDVSAIKQYTDYAILMDKGKVYSIGDSNTIVNQYTNLMASESNTVSISDRNAETSSEYRYGSGKGEIYEFDILDEKICSKNAFISGEAIIVKYKVKFNENIKNPIYAMTIKTKSGLEIYGTNTMYEQFQFESVKKGEIKEVEFSIKNLNLGIGDYFISLGVVEMLDSNISPIDRRYDVINFKMIPSDKSFGLINLNSNIKVKKLKENNDD